LIFIRKFVTRIRKKIKSNQKSNRSLNFQTSLYMDDVMLFQHISHAL